MLGSGVGTHLVLTVDSSANLSGLNQTNYLLFHLLDGPTKGGRHPLKFDRREWLEVQDQCATPDQVSEVLEVLAEVNIDDVSRLWVEMRVSIQRGGCATYRVSFEEIQNGTEFTRHVGFHKFPNVWLVLDVYREGLAPQQLRFDRGTREAGERTKSPGNTNIAWSNELLNNEYGQVARICGRKPYFSDPVTKFLDRSQFQEEIRSLLIVSLSKVGKGACEIEFCLPFSPFLRFLGGSCAWNYGSRSG